MKERKLETVTGELIHASPFCLIGDGHSSEMSPAVVHTGNHGDLSMDYREKMGADRLIEEYTPPEVLQKYLAGGLCGHDKDGSPIKVELFGRMDMKGIMYSTKKSDLEKTKLLQCELTVRDWEKQSEKMGKNVSGLTVIFDMRGVSSKMLWKPGLQMYLHLVKILEDNYPEMMKRMFVINAPIIFPLLYRICRPLISEDMKKKIFVLGHDYQKTLFEYVDAEEVPAFLGGTMTDPDGDPNCKSLICMGGEVPKSYYLEENEQLQNMQSVEIPKGDKVLLDFSVEKPGSYLKWEFKTTDYDIGFGIFLRKDSELVPIVAEERVDSHIVTEDGSIVCEEAGTYAVSFDNSFSWTRNKIVHYHVDVIASDEELKEEINELIKDADWETLTKTMETTHL
uniref:Retinal-binding protein n=1 Tax=Nautilus pompilius TaxID=34573 RepID=A0A977R1C5_9MOLL|nr:retinal-binding protein [Nautilus pompilius]